MSVQLGAPLGAPFSYHAQVSYYAQVCHLAVQSAAAKGTRAAPFGKNGRYVHPNPRGTPLPKGV